MANAIRWLEHLSLRRREPARDPRRARRMLHKYDVESGYAAYHAACRERFARDLAAPSAAPAARAGAAASDALGARGYAYLPVAGAAAAGELLRELASYRVASVKKNKPELEGFQIDDRAMRDRLLEAALTPAVDACIARRFGSEYLVHWFAVTPTEPGGGTDSFRWHCDRGPTAHLKLLVYLNDDAEHGGRTAFVDREATARIATSGYLFARQGDRLDDLSALAAETGAEWSPESRAMAPGDGVLFEPSCVLHRGIRPTRGTRTVLALCLLPSPVGWRRALERGAIVDLRRDPKWHRDAGALLERLA